MRITGIDNYTLNGPEGLVCRYLGGHGAVQINAQSRNRAGLHPVIDSFTQRERTATLQVYQQAGWNMHRDDLNELVHEIFHPPLGTRTLTMEYNGDTYTTECFVTSLEMPNDTLGVRWLVQITIPSGVWHGSEPVVYADLSDPVIVEGNVPALPTLVITGGEPVTRQRVTYTDRTGHGVSAYLVSVEPADDLEEHQYIIYANGLQIPFRLADGRLFFRIDAPPPPDREFVDIYSGESINNTVTAGRLDPAGTTLNAALSSGTVEADTAAAISNPLAPSLAWHPSITYRHESRRPYVFGLDGNVITLVDSDVARDQPGLPDDVDSYVIVTGSEAERIRNLNLTVEAGYQPSIDEANQDGTPVRRMRIRMGSVHGFGASRSDLAFVTWKFGEYGFPTPLDKTTSRTDTSIRLPQHPSVPLWQPRTQYQAGALVYYPESVPENVYRATETHESGQFFTGIGQGLWTMYDRSSSSSTSTTPSPLPQPQDFAQYAGQFFSLPVIAGEPGVFYIDFPITAFGGIEDIPLLEMQLWYFEERDTEHTNTEYPADGIWSREHTYQTEWERLAHEPIGKPRVAPQHLFKADWVSPVTNEPINKNPDSMGLLPDPINGQAKPTVKYRRRDSEHWITAWSRVVTGEEPGGKSQDFVNLNIATPGAVEIAIGLEPVASRAGLADWGRLRVTSTPIIDLQADRMPGGVASTPIEAQHINRTIRNHRTSARLMLRDYLADGGVEVDTQNLTIQGLNGAGPVYGRLQANRGAAMFQLAPGENDVDGDDTEIRFTERIAI